jgi:ribose 5-phosphate isomerase B
VEHDDINVLCMGARVIGTELAGDILRAFASARFSGEERHLRRVGKVLEIERSHGGRGE